MGDDPLNLSVRKFLKIVGVTSQRRIEEAVREARSAGRLEAGQTLPAAVRLSVPAIGLDVVVDGTIEVG